MPMETAVRNAIRSRPIAQNQETERLFVLTNHAKMTLIFLSYSLGRAIHLSLNLPSSFMSAGESGVRLS